ncbi:DUF305 domain-containing protein [Altererythrobacter sp. H2]|uniref:CopM family metallochaperone n=1 Tax=Altererythrobacter sp. H2 TaxID=3108391 RepID=UPI000BDCA40C|nr:DUF305 domain-containing protein [Altererythrobacter sp. H2]OZA94069.1 MAG: hypothetical protein B7X57_02810 [Erythrobacter sp. 34-65-8]WRK95879.1 DUF305 domain-containing protein [Altererythrobacter sp. H2]
MMRMIAALALALVLAACSGEPATDTAEGAAAPAMTEAQAAYDAASQRMHEGMTTVDADPDVAFMQGMLAHHRGAVEMSEVALKYGTDEKVRELATRVIATQQAEIEEMERWLRVRNAIMESAGAGADASAAADPHANH